MRQIPTFFEFLVTACLASFGIFMLKMGWSNKIEYESGFAIIVGGTFLAVGLVILFYLIGSLVWHLEMLEEFGANDDEYDGEEYDDPIVILPAVNQKRTN